MSKNIKLLVLDIDNTLFDWVTYYVTAIDALINKVEEITGIDKKTLSEDCRTIFGSHGSIEYPFLVQELPSVVKKYGQNIDELLNNVVAPARDSFLEVAEDILKPYDSVPETLETIRKNNPDMSLVALTDAPRYVAMWKMNKLGILHSFDAMYGLPDPKLPTDPVLGRVKVDPEILLKHLQQSNFDFKGSIRILPDEYEKPGTRGLKTVLMDYEMDEDPEQRNQVLWVGDNLRKDVGLGQKLGIKTAWARYGTNIAKEHSSRLLEISPMENIQKHANLVTDPNQLPKPDIELNVFSDILKLIDD